MKYLTFFCWIIVFGLEIMGIGYGKEPTWELVIVQTITLIIMALDDIITNKRRN